MSHALHANARLRWLLVPGILAISFALASPANAKKRPSREQVQHIVVEEALENRSVPPSIALAVARVESNFDPFARSHAGARGVMQIMPRTAWTEFRVESQSLWDARLNARLGIRYLEKLYHQYGRRWDLALSHYNGGSIKRNRRGRLEIHHYTRNYVDQVLRISRRYERDASVATLVARTKAVRAPEIEAEPEELAYWMYDEPGADRDWRDYLRAADHWLDKADVEARESTATKRKPRQPEPAYWDTRTPDVEPIRYESRAAPSRYESRVSETRRRFRERLAAEEAGRRS